MEYLDLTTPYFWQAVRYLVIIAVVVLVAEAGEWYARKVTSRGDESVGAVLRNCRRWRNAFSLSLFALCVSAVAGGLPSTVLPYIAGVIIVFEFFRTIDRECSPETITRGAIRTAEVSLYICFTLSLVDSMLFQSM
jgi:hypothetical protein